MERIILRHFTLLWLFRFSGVTAADVPYSGTYDRTWVGTRTP